MKKCPDCNKESNNEEVQCNSCGFPFENSTSNFLFSRNSHKAESANNVSKKESTVKVNLFQGRTEAENGSAKFPDWDIVPPTQFINPRIKQQ